MPIHFELGNATLLAYGHEFRGPLIAFAVALALALAGRFLRIGLVAAAAGGAGVLAGWYAISGRLWVTSPHLSVDDLTPLAGAMLLIGLLCARLGPGRGASIGMLLAAAFAGWWLSGAPMHLAGLRADWPIALGVAAAVLLFARLLAASMLEPLRLALAGLTMAASLHVVAAPPVWALLALVPALAAVAMLALPAMPGPVALPVAADTAAVGSLAVIAIGRFRRLGVGSIDVAALSPLLALWLVPHVAARLRVAGRAAPVVACVVAGAIAVAAAWGAHRALPR